MGLRGDFVGSYCTRDLRGDLGDLTRDLRGVLRGISGDIVGYRGVAWGISGDRVGIFWGSHAYPFYFKSAITGRCAIAHGS